MADPFTALPPRIAAPIIFAKSQENDMDKLEKIAVLDNEVQAELVDSVLSERDIPHIMRSYYNSALDGIYQTPSGWGHVEAPASFREEILGVIEDIKRQASSETAPESPPANGK